MQTYAKQKFLVTPTIGGGGKTDKKQQRKILDVGSLEEPVHKTIYNDLYT